MLSIKVIERKWINNFRKCILVDKETACFKSNYAHQLFYGKAEDSYLVDWPENFSNLFSSYDKEHPETVVENLIEYLHFIGINIRKEAISKHLDLFPGDYTKLIKKCYYIFKALAHYQDDLNVDNPYHDNNGDLYFLLRIESEQSVHGGQLNLFEDVELPDLYSKVVTLPKDYEKNIIVQDLFKQIEQSNKSFFITGKAGTGKSTFIHYFAQKTEKKILLLAFTGIAAINVGGQTIHSFFRLPLKPLMPEDEEITRFKNFTQKYSIIQKIDTIVIDEVSMLRSDLLEAVDFSLRNNGGDPTKKFGGKQILFIGDIFQLPPVVDSTDETDEILFSEIYDSEYFFDSHSYKELNPEFFEFNKSHRQKDDLPFVGILDEVRICQISGSSIDKLNERYDPSYTPNPDEFSINLTSTNAIANAENSKRLLEIPYTKYSFEAEIIGEYSPQKYPAAKSLELKKNAQVIFIKNDNAGERWVNGTIAKIDFISNDLIEVNLQTGETYKLEKVTWENRKYKFNREKKKIASEVIGTFTQFPIKLAWAITIHKSQGLTFDKVVIDMGTGAFVNGQLYTALSRCRSLNGIVLKRRIRKEDIIADKRLINFHKLVSNNNVISVTQNDKSVFLKENVEFVRTLFAIHYPFSHEQLEQFSEQLPLGSGGYSLNIDAGSMTIWVDYGLAFNQKISWTSKLKELYFKPSILLYADGGVDEYLRVNFEEFPLKFEEEIQFAIDSWQEKDFNLGILDDQGFHLTPTVNSNSKFLTKNYSNMPISELIDLAERFKRNESEVIPSFIFNEELYKRIHAIICGSELEIDQKALLVLVYC